jgi:hypothetical protein
VSCALAGKDGTGSDGATAAVFVDDAAAARESETGGAGDVTLSSVFASEEISTSASAPVDCARATAGTTVVESATLKTERWMKELR